MAHCNTILSQILKLVPRHEFEKLANQHHSGRSFRTASRWSQFVCMLVGQLTERRSLRDVVDSMGTQFRRLYHLGSANLSRSNLARINENKPHALYEELFGVLLGRASQIAPGHKFRFKNDLYSMDATTIDLCLSVFPWAKFRKNKGGIKLNVAMNHRGNLPEFVSLSNTNEHEMKAGREVNFPKGSIVAADRGYTGYKWYKTLIDKGIYFVVRLKSNAKIRVLERREVDRSSGVTSDQTIEFTGAVTSAKCPCKLRRVGFYDEVTGRHYVFLTNNFKLAASTIAQIYKSRWDIELFFKWIKQNLKIKSFYGTSRNAVLTQIWIAMCAYLLIALLKFQSKIDLSMQKIFRLLQLNLFEKWHLNDLLDQDKHGKPNTNDHQPSLL